MNFQTSVIQEPGAAGHQVISDPEYDETRKVDDHHTETNLPTANEVEDVDGTRLSDNHQPAT